MARGDGHLTVGISRPEQRLSHAFKELNRQWADTSPYWRDEARSAFQKNFMEELFTATRGGVSAMAELERFLSQIIQECG